MTDGVYRREGNSYEIKQCFTRGSGLDRPSDGCRRQRFARWFFLGREPRRTAIGVKLKLSPGTNAG
jgi:hypothetical protein